MYGARPLKRFLEKRVVTQLGRMILDRTLVDNSLVTISVGLGDEGACEYLGLRFTVTAIDVEMAE